jgi:ComF family protein
MNRIGRNVPRWFAQDCRLCGSESGAELLCAGCTADLPLLPEHCPQCALPSPGGALCGQCLNRPPRFDRTLALWRYDFPCDTLVQALKYGARIALAGFFARSLSNRGLPAVDLVVPMPLHPRRLADRGFNQALEIARELGHLAGLTVAARSVRRVKDTVPQTELPYDKRARNVRGAFDCGLDLSEKSIAVIDDVMTTGATLNELARVLKRAGAIRVENWVVARTMPR